MHEYLMEVQKYFGGKLRFQVVAENRDEAKELGRKYVFNHLDSDNMIKDSLRVVKKLKNSFKDS